MKKKNKQKRLQKGSLAISQILILVIGIIAISYAVGSSLEVVSAGEGCTALGGTCIDTNTQSCDDGEIKIGLCPGADNIRCCIPLKKEKGEPSLGTTDKPTTIEIKSILHSMGIQLVTEEMVSKVREAMKGGATTLAQAATDVVYESAYETAYKAALASAPGNYEAAATAGQTAGQNAISGTGAGAPKDPSFLKKLLGKSTLKESLKAGYFTAIIIVAYTFISVGIKTGDWGRAAETALRKGIGAGVGLGAYAGLVALGLGPAGWIASGFVMLGAWASKFLKRAQDRDITFVCKPWQSQSGGSDCTLCNNKDFPCTEYQCRSLGTGCELINKDTDNPRCIHKDPRDVDPPTITPWEDVLTEDYKYYPLPRGQYGVEIKFQNKECLPAFQPFTFGVELDKEGYCRIEFEKTASFEDMKFDFSGNIFTTKHSHVLSFPGVANIQDFLDKLELGEEAVSEIRNDGEYELYVRCMAASSGKANRGEFLFKFCIDKGPDTTAPTIRGFNWRDSAPIAYFGEDEEKKVDIQVYTNKPAQCKWGREDKSYADMENSLDCSNSLITFNAQISYTCSGKLTGLENREENKFFFRCNDTFGNVNVQSTTLTLVGTQPLIIDSVSPNNTIIKGGTSPIKVTLEAETSAGYKDGEAECSYSRTGTSGTYERFTNTNSHRHSTNIWLESGNYNYFIKCIDWGGNADTKNISFSVDVDTKPPIVVRIYHEEKYLKLVTDEAATCVYDNVDCSYNFEDGLPMISLSETDHFVKWNPNINFYIKCADDYGNQPDECSITARPFEIGSE